MSFLSSIPPDAKIPHVVATFPDASKPLMDFHEVVLRGPSALSVGERELIAAFVSALNLCDYCAGVHQGVALEFGIAPDLLADLVADDHSPALDPRFKPILQFVRKLTLTPNKITKNDAEAIFAAGWEERTLFDVVSVCALFNFMNRFVEGLGIRGDAEYFALASKRLSQKGYEWQKPMTNDD